MYYVTTDAGGPKVGVLRYNRRERLAPLPHPPAHLHGRCTRAAALLGGGLLCAVRLCLGAQGNLVEAVPLIREALGTARATLGPQHNFTLIYMSVLANMLVDLGKVSEAEALYREALKKQLATLGPKHQETLTLVNNLGSLLQSQGRLGEAE